MDEKKSNIVSLSYKKTESNLKSRKKYLTLEQRVQELEDEVFRVIDQLIELEHKSHLQGKYIWKLLDQLKSRND